MKQKVVVICSQGDAEMAHELVRKITDSFGSDVEIITAKSIDEIKDHGSCTVMTSENPYGRIMSVDCIYATGASTELPKIFVDKKRKGWQRPYKYHR